jgi:predicted ATPase
MIASICHQYRRDVREVQHTAEGVMALSAEHRITDSLPWVTFLRGSAMAAHGRHKEGIALIHEGLAMFRAAGAEGTRTVYLCWLAEACTE